MVALSAQCLVSGDGFQTVDSVDTFLLGVLAAGGEVRCGSLTVGHISKHKSVQNPKIIK